MSRRIRRARSTDYTISFWRHILLPQIDLAAKKEAKPMAFIWQRLSMIAIAVVIVLGAGAIAFVRPHPISEPELGTEWQCSRAAFVVTCNHR